MARDLGVNEIFVRLLVGHALTGVRASYLTRLVVSGDPSLRAAQVATSRRVLGLLGGRNLDGHPWLQHQRDGHLHAIDRHFNWERVRGLVIVGHLGTVAPIFGNVIG